MRRKSEFLAGAFLLLYEPVLDLVNRQRRASERSPLVLNQMYSDRLGLLEKPQVLCGLCNGGRNVREINSDEDAAIDAGWNAISHQDRSAARPCSALGGSANEGVPQYLPAMRSKKQEICAKFFSGVRYSLKRIA